MKPKTFISVFVIIAMLLGAFVFFQKKKTNTIYDNNGQPPLTDEEKTEYEAVKKHLQNYISRVEKRGDTPACYASENGERYCIHTDFKENKEEGGEMYVNSKTVFDMIVKEFGLNVH